MEGVRVLDISGPAGYYCTKLMADMGADVVRVDPPDVGQNLSPGPFYGGRSDRDHSIYRWHYHTNKRSILLDLKSESGRGVFDSLLTATDVLMDTFRPSEAATLGLDSPSLRADYPSLIHTTITGFGDEGPYSDYKATDIVAQAMGGLMALTGFPGEAPGQLGGEQAYHMASLHAAVGTMVAILSRDMDSAGRDVHVSMQDCVSMATLQTANFNYYTWDGIIRSRTGLNHAFSGQKQRGERRSFPRTLYKTSDGWIAYAAHLAPPHAWRNTVAWMAETGEEQDLGDARFDDPEVRITEQEHINRVMSDFAAKHTSNELYHSAQKLRLLCTPVQSVADLVKDEQLDDRDWFVEVEHPEIGEKFTYPGAPYKLSDTPWQIRKRAPLVGEHTHEVLGDWLGMSSEEADNFLRQEPSSNER
ncbi:MAG: CoA transferase [SAR202 cluster bacterium]|nr:CoA transferase [SAR202 cluster bacterium]MDP6715099.1 CoA transferase [SAR202 cluster bacterium]